MRALNAVDESQIAARGGTTRALAEPLQAAWQFLGYSVEQVVGCTWVRNQGSPNDRWYLQIPSCRCNCLLHDAFGPDAGRAYRRSEEEVQRRRGCGGTKTGGSAEVQPGARKLAGGLGRPVTEMNLDEALRCEVSLLVLAACGGGHVGCSSRFEVDEVRVMSTHVGRSRQRLQDIRRYCAPT